MLSPRPSPQQPLNDHNSSVPQTSAENALAVVSTLAQEPFEMPCTLEDIQMRFYARGQLTFLNQNP